MSTAGVRILVVDDHEPWRRYVSSILQKQVGLNFIYEASDGLEAVERAGELQPDLIVLDIGLPALNGIEAARQIRKLSPESRIVFLSMESCADLAQEALCLGAKGYVAKEHAASELIPAVEAVFRGNQFVSRGWSSDWVPAHADLLCQPGYLAIPSPPTTRSH